MTATSISGGVFSGSGPALRWLRQYRRGPARWVRPPKTAFVLAGGGARGAAQVGMLHALTSHGIRADAVYGCSVGALNAAAYAGRPTLAGIEYLTEIWKSVTSDDVFPHGRIPAPWRFLQQRDAVFSNDGLRRIIEEGVAFERIEEAPVHLEVVTTSLDSGADRWITQGPAVPAILASAALPALLPPVLVEGELCIDGGVVDNVPISRAISEGARLVFVLLCGPLRFRRARYRRPVEAVLTAFSISMHSRFTRDLESLPAGVDVVVFCVDSSVVTGYDDFSKTEALIEAGRDSAQRVLQFWEAGHTGEVVHQEEHDDLFAPDAQEVGGNGRADMVMKSRDHQASK